MFPLRDMEEWLRVGSKNELSQGRETPLLFKEGAGVVLTGSV